MNGSGAAYHSLSGTTDVPVCEHHWVFVLQHLAEPETHLGTLPQIQFLQFLHSTVFIGLHYVSIVRKQSKVNHGY
jgi:hypothetical protein